MTSITSPEDLIALFERVGIDPTRAAMTVKNKKFSAALASTIQEAGCEAGAEKSVGVLLDALAGNCTADAALNHRPFVARKIANKGLKTEEQVQGIYMPSPCLSLIIILFSCY